MVRKQPQEPRVLPEPIRVERKMIHGEMVDVKIYESQYKPDDDFLVRNNEDPIVGSIEWSGMMNNLENIFSNMV